MQVLSPGANDEYEPCADDWMVNYLNRDDVKKVGRFCLPLRFALPVPHTFYVMLFNVFVCVRVNECLLQAVHADVSIKWVECATQVHYNMADRLIPMQPIYKELLESDAGLDILVYSGDDDAVCGTIGTQEWIWDLGYAPVSKDETWKTWSFEDQVAGYSTKFNVDTGSNNHLTFLTVHKAGHEVPTYVPEQALDLFKKYLDGYWAA